MTEQAQPYDSKHPRNWFVYGSFCRNCTRCMLTTLFADIDRLVYHKIDIEYDASFDKISTMH